LEKTYSREMVYDSYSSFDNKWYDFKMSDYEGDNDETVYHDDDEPEPSKSKTSTSDQDPAYHLSERWDCGRNNQSKANAGAIPQATKL